MRENISELNEDGHVEGKGQEERKTAMIREKG
jgi:hypothetical protein